MSNIQIFNNEQLNMRVRTILNNDNSVSINVEDTILGFGIIKIDIKNDKKYTRLDFPRFQKYIEEFNFGNEFPKITKDDYIPESLFYMLGMKASNKAAQEFQKWLAIDVIPAIRKTGSYVASNSQNVISEMRAQMETLVNDIVSQKVNEIEKKCSNYYRPACLEKYKIGQYIKKRLGIKKADEEYEIIKDRVLLKLNANKWEDVPVEVLLNSLNLIDESIRIIKLDRPVKQLTIFDM